MVAVGTIVWLSSELMFFAALFAMYFTIRGHEPELWDERTVMLNVPVRPVQHHRPGRLVGLVPARRAAGRAGHRGAARRHAR